MLRPKMDEISTIYLHVMNPFFSCVGIEEGQAAEVETYHCPNCQEEHGPLVCKYFLFSH